MKMCVSLQQRVLENVEMYVSVQCAKMHESCVSPQFCASTVGYGVGGGGVFSFEGRTVVLKSLISTCVLSCIGSREYWFT